MYFGVLFFLGSLLLCVFSQSDTDKVCYYAKTCIHDNKEKCGVSKDGTARRFIDSCDIKEYNCLKGTDYVKTALTDCKSLPPLENSNETN